MSSLSTGNQFTGYNTRLILRGQPFYFDMESSIIINEESGIVTEFSDIEIIHRGRFNTIMKAKRHGRLWVLKGLPEALRGSSAHIQLLRKEFGIMSGFQHPISEPGDAAVAFRWQKSAILPTDYRKWAIGWRFEPFLPTEI